MAFFIYEIEMKFGESRWGELSCVKADKLRIKGIGMLLFMMTLI